MRRPQLHAGHCAISALLDVSIHIVATCAICPTQSMLTVVTVPTRGDTGPTCASPEHTREVARFLSTLALGPANQANEARAVGVVFCNGNGRVAL